MRARRFLPTVDGLDRRLLLSDVSTGLPGSGMIGLPPGSMPGDEVDPVVVLNYYGPGNPPPDTDDPTNPPDPTDDGGSSSSTDSSTPGNPTMVTMPTAPTGDGSGDGSDDTTDGDTDTGN